MADKVINFMTDALIFCGLSFSFLIFFRLNFCNRLVYTTCMHFEHFEELLLYIFLDSYVLLQIISFIYSFLHICLDVIIAGVCTSLFIAVGCDRLLLRASLCELVFVCLSLSLELTVQRFDVTLSRILFGILTLVNEFFVFVFVFNIKLLWFKYNVKLSTN